MNAFEIDKIRQKPREAWTPEETAYVERWERIQSGEFSAGIPC
jgi:hypothetical protein